MLYTDGLVERRREPLTAGIERLRRLAVASGTADALAQRVVDHLIPRGGADDDVAIVVVRNLLISPQMRLRFPATPQVLSQIRQVLRRWLHAYGAASQDIAAITLACGEACANAIEHAYSPAPTSFEIDAEHDAGLVTLIVRDSGRWRSTRATDRGRGLRMIEATVDELEVRSTDAGTEVIMRRRLRSA
jgi:anti-sigma regulatory factor (Ser/Thr protein kinase)